MKHVCDGLENVIIAPSLGVDKKSACLKEIKRLDPELRAPTDHKGAGRREVRDMNRQLNILALVGTTIAKSEEEDWDVPILIFPSQSLFKDTSDTWVATRVCFKLGLALARFRMLRGLRVRI